MDHWGKIEMSKDSLRTLLGVCDEPIPTKVITSWHISKLGGMPDWMTADSVFPKCEVCGCLLTFVCQIYCPLDGSPYHRTIYVFACRSKPCFGKSESWMVLRCQSKDSAVNGAPTSVGKEGSVLGAEDWMPGADDWRAGADDWCAGADDWGVGADGWGVGDGRRIHHSEMAPCDSLWTDKGSNLSADIEIDNTDTNSGASQRFSEDDSISDVAELVQEIAVEDRTSKEISASSCAMSGDVTVEDRTADPAESVLYEMVAGMRVSKGAPDDTPIVESLCVLLSYYVAIIDEPECDADQFEHERRLLKEYSLKEGVNLDELIDNFESQGKGSGGGGEKYEKCSAKHGDQTFYKFARRIQRCPQQIIRYSYGGEPLLMQRTREQVAMKQGASPHVIPACMCGSVRQFELQLMPSLISYLRELNDSDPVIEFGCAYVYTCSRNCWSDDGKSMKREFVFVQADTDQQYFRN